MIDFQAPIVKHHVATQVVPTMACVPFKAHVIVVELDILIHYAQHLRALLVVYMALVLLSTRVTVLHIMSVPLVVMHKQFRILLLDALLLFNRVP
jgi:hypothetical protein